MPNEWRTIIFVIKLVHKIRLHGRRGKGMAESIRLARKIKARTAEEWMKNPV